ncbi:MAG: hypothetical protein EZS28_026775 [Streblomastix strix]|uniref:Uncharacterized protein n=1 Tax=Streblomastix strix TaxID=222440 RepID=A0A5J4V478_9EUKA|nr:MAG: hypothetical protein EZS28_026775 [Streblomastix strix]
MKQRNRRGGRRRRKKKIRNEIDVERGIDQELQNLNLNPNFRQILSQNVRMSTNSWMIDSLSSDSESENDYVKRLEKYDRQNELEREKEKIEKEREEQEMKQREIEREKERLLMEQQQKKDIKDIEKNKKEDKQKKIVQISIKHPKYPQFLHLHEYQQEFRR